MEQLTQLLKDGEMQLREVPYPLLTEGKILVRNYYSVISAGTEGKTVHDARLGYIGKARARRDEVGKVVAAARTYGVRDTYKMVMNKLETPSALGYSCAGRVMAVADDVSGFKTGDLVACGGNSANHAEVVAVPVNLCVRIPESVSLRDASFSTLGAVAMQGVRQADLRLGERAVVIGLGLVGQLSIQILQAAGVRVAGIDVNDQMVSMARSAGCDLALHRNDEQLEDTLQHFTQGFGADAVIITAGAKNTDPVDLAGALCRQKGKVVIVGDVPTGFKRPHYFKKELDLRMSCSYGPGRYDPDYEEKGIDYPIGYVRWTENRNMQSFVDLLEHHKITLDPIITHEFAFADAADAYQVILGKQEPYAGVVLKYETKHTPERSVRIRLSPAPGKVNLGMIGAGSFAQNFLLPNLPASVERSGVVTAHGHTARHVADKFGFAYAAGSTDEIFGDEHINTIIIATRHDRHADLVIRALRAGKNVFVEKPLALTSDELEAVRQAYQEILSSSAKNRFQPDQAAGRQGLVHTPSLMVGFNRRFAPLVERLRTEFSTRTPVAIHYRVNAGTVPAGHWVQDPKVGGGRIVGETCHFIDLATFMAGSPITMLSATALTQDPDMKDTVSISMKFANGSIASLSYFSNGSKTLPKEHLEIFGGGKVAQLIDFRELQVYGQEKKKYKLTKADKGHAAGLGAFVDSVAAGKPCPVSFEEIYQSSLAPFKVIESIHSGNSVIF